MNWESQDDKFIQQGETVKVYTGDKEVHGNISFLAAIREWVAGVHVMKCARQKYSNDSYSASFGSKEEAKTWVEERILDQCDSRRSGR